MSKYTWAGMSSGPKVKTKAWKSAIYGFIIGAVYGASYKIPAVYEEYDRLFHLERGGEGLPGIAPYLPLAAIVVILAASLRPRSGKGALAALAAGALGVFLGFWLPAILSLIVF